MRFPHRPGLVGRSLLLLCVLVVCEWNESAGQEVSGGGVFRIVFFPGQTLDLKVDLGTERRATLEGARALKGKTVDARVVSPFVFSGCEVVRRDAHALLRVEDAVAAQSGGRPGFVLLRLVSLDLADGSTLPLEGGYYCQAGEDRSDRGRKLLIFPRKGGAAKITNGALIRTPFVAARERPEGCAATEDRTPKKDEEEQPAPIVVTIAASACAPLKEAQ